MKAIKDILQETIPVKQSKGDKTILCPNCNKSFTGYPALSRKDNKTEICSKCGTIEALKDYFSRRN